MKQTTDWCRSTGITILAANLMKQSWYKNAVFYSLDVETFFDANDDGVGDFQGLIDKLDYIADLGVTCIWLLPFYATPNRDNGYDVMDYCRVDERLGTMDDFKEFMTQAGKRRIRVIIDLVVNHTSNEHPWFQEGRANPGSKYHNYYVWSDRPKSYERQHLMFAGEEGKVWSFDEQAGKFYLHRFYKEQPDLNIGNRDVQVEILDIMKFWLATGISGFRLDAAEILVEPYGMNGTPKAKLSAFLAELRREMNAINKEAVLIAEANLKPNEMKSFLLHNGRMQMIFNFDLNQHIFLALAAKKATPLMQALRSLPHREEEQQWLNFLRHHDELSLVLLNRIEQHIVFERFAPAENMRIFNRGIRRRLAPMVDNNAKILRLCFTLLFCLPGAPLVRYGDEIGMGEDLSLSGRNSVRTPMQWSSSKNGGFSNASKEQLVHPMIENETFGYTRVNVAAELRQKNSLLYWIKDLIAFRKAHPAIGEGKVKLVNNPSDELLLYLFLHAQEELLFIHNLSPKPCTIHMNDLLPEGIAITELPGNGVAGDRFVIDGYGSWWTVLHQAKDKIWQ